jgi:hypothetical protein
MTVSKFRVFKFYFLDNDLKKTFFTVLEKNLQ